MEWTWKGFYDSEGSYWSDEEVKPSKTQQCQHVWVDKPLFNMVHNMCDKCGITKKEYEDEKFSKSSIAYYD